MSFIYKSLKLIGIAILVNSSVLFAKPSNPTIVNGNVKISNPTQKSMHITASDKAIINWKDFSIGQGEMAKFIQPSSEAYCLNRVTGKGSSELLGQLKANGNILLLNPNGILIGKDAIIDTNSFTASVLQILDSDFLNNKDLEFAGKSVAKIENYGTITAWDGDVALIGYSIINEGTIKAEKGSALLATGQNILMQPKGKDKIFIRSDLNKHMPENKDTAIIHNGKIEALKTEIKVYGNPYAHAIKLKGEIKSSSIVKKDGKILLVADGGKIDIEDKISGKNSPIEIVAEKVSIYKNAIIKTDKENQISISAFKIYNEGKIESPFGDIILQSNLDKSFCMNVGEINTSSNNGGKISITTDRYFNSGKITSEGIDGLGGEINICYKDNFIETQNSKLSVFSANNKAGFINVHSRDKGRLFTSGNHNASGKYSGKIHLMGNDINLIAANIEANGKNGGEILIGGDYQGKNDGFVNATKVLVNPSTEIYANANENGDGGRIIIWSDNETQFLGTISANAGTISGDGGFIEVSGKEDLTFDGIHKHSFSSGKPSELLLDPQNIIIDSALGVFPQFALIEPTDAAGTTMGTSIAVNNGYLLITKPSDSTSGETASGAIYLYNGDTGALISALYGDTASDQIGSGGSFALTGNNHFVAASPSWASNKGAATWIDGTSGLSGTISSSNSLVGATAGGQVSFGTNGSTSKDGIVTLSNGNYVVVSPKWIYSTTPSANAGAVTWCNGSAGRIGTVSASNSLYSRYENNYTGRIDASTLGVVELLGAGAGNFIIISPSYGVSTTATRGCVTWINGSNGYLYTGVLGDTIRIENSLMGNEADDQLGSKYAILTNGNYVVGSPLWNIPSGNNDVGCAVWCNKTGSTVGYLTTSYQIIYGNAGNDLISNPDIYALANGNYVVASQYWDSNLGAVTIGWGATGRQHKITVSGTSYHSIVGPGTNSYCGRYVLPLTDGNYLIQTAGNVGSSGAISWVNGTTGYIYGGSTLADVVGTGNSYSFSGGTYTVGSYGAHAIANGAAIIVGRRTTDGVLLTQIPAGGGTHVNVTALSCYIDTSSFTDIDVKVLSNDNYVLFARYATAGGTTARGMVVTMLNNPSDTLMNWIDGTRFNTAGTSGGIEISPATYGIRGGTDNDNVGSRYLIGENNNYAIVSPNYQSGGDTLGAITLVEGTNGYLLDKASPDTRAATVSIANSLVGGTDGDNIGSNNGSSLVIPNTNNYLISSPLFQSGSNIGAVTYLDGDTGLAFGETAYGAQVPTTQNSIVNTQTNGASSIAYDSTNSSFIAAFNNSTVAGRVVIGLPEFALTAASVRTLAYAKGQAATMYLQPSVITNIIDNGSALILQANNDITVNTGFTQDPAATTNLHFRAGRSIIINDDITMGLGNLYLVSNELLTSGVVDSYTPPLPTPTVTQYLRESGAGGVSIAAGKTVNSYLGKLELETRTGTGKTYSTPGDLTLGAAAVITDDSLSTRPMEIYSNRDILFGAGANLMQASNDDVFEFEAVRDITFGAGAYASFNEGINTVAAGRDINLAGGYLYQRRTNKSMLVTAGRNINLTSQGYMKVDGAGYLRATATNNFYIGPQSYLRIITAGANVQPLDITATNGYVKILNAGYLRHDVGKIIVTAGTDITLYPRAYARSWASTLANPGNVTFTAGRNIELNNLSNVQTAYGDILLTSYYYTNIGNSATVQTASASKITLVTDNAYPTSPNYGPGGLTIGSSAALTTGGGNNITLFTSQPYKNSIDSSATFNATPLTHSTSNTAREIYGVWYSAGSTTTSQPFTMFYKATDVVLTPALQNQLEMTMYGSMSEQLRMLNPYNNWINRYIKFRIDMFDTPNSNVGVKTIFIRQPKDLTESMQEPDTL
jgi:trimeric autotransporter adhesin